MDRKNSRTSSKHLMSSRSPLCWGLTIPTTMRLGRPKS